MLAAVFAAALFFWSGSTAFAAPALWLVQSPAGKVYLFGTVHLLREQTQWQSPELEGAIAQSQDLYLEIADPMNGSAMSSVFKIGFDRDHPLSTKISKEDVALLDAAAKRYGYGGEAFFEPMQPWLAYMVLSLMPATHSGYSAGYGVDLQVRKEFVAAGKPVRGFETADMQMHLFADIPQAQQVVLLESVLKGAAAPAAATAPTTAGESGLDAIVSAWMSGDEDQLEKALHYQSFATSDLGTRLVADRNKNWASVLAQRLQQPGTSFVSVGAAHLIGPDGVPALLAKMGFTVTRVPIAQTLAVASPSPEPSTPAVPVPSETPATPAASPTPIPRTIEPPAGWRQKTPSSTNAVLKTDMLWTDPKGGAGIVTGHFDLPGSAQLDLDTLATLLQQGMTAASGQQSSTPNKHVRICGGKQDGILASVTVKALREEVVVAVSDRPYIAEYVRAAGAPEDPAALRSLLSLCAP